MDQLSLKAGYRNYRLTPASGSEVRADMWWTGANYQATPVVGLTAALYCENIKAGATSKETGSDPLMLVCLRSIKAAQMPLTYFGLATSSLVAGSSASAVPLV